MNPALRDRLALVAAVICVLAGTLAWSVGRVGIGLELALLDDQLVVQTVERAGFAWREGVQPGMIVWSVDGTPVAELSDVEREALTRLPPGQYELVLPRDLPLRPDEEYSAEYFESASQDQMLRSSGGALFAGLGLLLGIGWWLRWGSAGDELRRLAIPLATAAAAPLLVLPAHLSWTSVGVLVVALALPLAMLPLAWALLEATPEPERRLLGFVSTGLAALWVIVAGSELVVPFDAGRFVVAEHAWLLLAAVPLVPGLAAARPSWSQSMPPPGAAQGHLTVAAVWVVAAVTPAVSILTMVNSRYGLFLLPLLLWSAAILLVARYSFRPLLRLVSRVQLQRDVVVAATEAERSRLAGELHDGALQDMTLLVRRLDASGDAEGAQLARSIADELRDVCGELRLPVLDDLGAGPALEWLVARVGRLAAVEIRLERADGSRAPTNVELAVFRVAQEALANAVKHGRAPIVVRYQATESGVSLAVDDSGSGIDPKADEEAVRHGRFGLLSMEQRAEQIGAILDVRRWPQGGTHVGFEWRSGKTGA